MMFHGIMKNNFLKFLVLVFFCHYAYAKTSKLRVFSCQISRDIYNALQRFWNPQIYALQRKHQYTLDLCGIKHVYLEPSEKLIEDDSAYVDLGTNLTVKFDFMPLFSSKNLKWEVTSVTLFGDWPLKTVDTDACKYSHCPIVPEEVNHFEAPVYIPDTLSAKKYVIRVKLINGNISADNCCFIGVVRLRRPPTTRKPVVSTTTEITSAKTSSIPDKEEVTKAGGSYFSFFKSKFNAWIGKKDESESANVTVTSSQNSTSNVTVGSESITNGTIEGNKTTAVNETTPGNETLVSNNKTADNNTAAANVTTGNETIAENEAAVSENQTEINEESTIAEQSSTSTAESVVTEANTTVADESPPTVTEKSTPAQVKETKKDPTTKKETSTIAVKTQTEVITTNKGSPIKTESTIKKETTSAKVTTVSKPTTVSVKKPAAKQETPSTEKQNAAVTSATMKATTTKSPTPTTNESTATQSSQAKTNPKSMTS